MLKRRLVPVLYLLDGWMVRSQQFSEHQYIGDPVVHVERMVDWDVDDLIVLDIGRGDMTFEHHRQDYRHKPVLTLLDFIERIAIECNIPLTFGGRIRTVEDIRMRIQHGADKVAVNALLADAPDTVTEAVHKFGSQAIVASVDFRRVDDEPRVFLRHGSVDTGVSPADWARRAESLGVGEILLNAIDRDGMAQGYDIEAIGEVVAAVNIPVIACGGAGHQRHFLECFERTEASAVAAGNIFHFTENAYPRAKSLLGRHRQDIRVKKAEQQPLDRRTTGARA
jgi:imidazole glycerol-phosphate synthase subunit HisF